MGTTGLGPEEQTALGELAGEQGVQLFVAPNFAVGAVLMMRFAAEAGRVLPRSEIIELHNESKHDAPSGTAKATADLLVGDTPIHSVRLPGLVAHQEVLFGEPGALLTIRHDAYSREAYVPGVLLTLERLPSLPPGLTVGLESLLEDTEPREGSSGGCRRMNVVLGELLTAIVTPFDRDGAVDYERFRELARHCVENGSDGLVVAATTGESPTLTDDERFELFATAVDAVGDGATVIGSTGTYSTAHSVHLTEKAHELGVDGFLVVTPYYNKPPPRGIVEHFKAIAAVSDRPIIVYNIPQRVVINIEPETIVELAEIPTVKAVKQATEEIDQAKRIVDGDRSRPLRGQRPPRVPVPRGRRRRRRVRARSDRRHAGEGDDPPLQGRGHGGRSRDRRGAEARRRGSRGDDQPDPGEGRAEHARARRRRAAAAARRGDRRGAGRDPVRPRARRRARVRPRLTGLSRAGRPRRALPRR